jgi:hypothetical protein
MVWQTMPKPAEFDLSRAFVIGNGTSRSSIDLQKLKNQGTIYGCNALYREFTPDFLIAVDAKMIFEINKSGFQHQIPVWTNYNKAYKSMTGFNYFEPSKGWSSGPTALWKASNDGHDEIYILGFDYQGLGNKVNNIYAGTKNYKAKEDKATFYGNWLKQTITVVKTNPEKRYIRVVADNGFMPKELVNLENLTHEMIENFQEIF